MAHVVISAEVILWVCVAKGYLWLNCFNKEVCGRCVAGSLITKVSEFAIEPSKTFIGVEQLKCVTFLVSLLLKDL